MKRRKALLRLVGSLLLVMAAFLSAQPASAYSEAPHWLAADRALQLYSNEEMVSYSAAILAGAKHEDKKDHVYDRSGGCLWVDHFWDADQGPFDPVDMIVVCADGSNSWQKAQILWGMAVGSHAAGDLNTAYEYLGHVAHLLADQSVPAHVHEDAHWPDDDCYEDWMSYSNAVPTADEMADLIAAGPVEIRAGIDPLYYLFYTTNQIGDFFPSDDYDGDTFDSPGRVDDPQLGGWMGQVYTELGLDNVGSPKYARDLKDNDWHWVDDDNNDDGDLGVIRHYSYAYSIRAIAALYRLFDQVTSSRSYLTLVIDQVDAQDVHDEGLVSPYKKADFYVDIIIGSRWFTNEGNQSVDQDHIQPRWAFGADVGNSPAQTTDMVIKLWDEDEAPNPDDLSDINSRGGARWLEFSADFSDGSLAGDIVGQAGETITSVGNNDDRSQIKFRVLLPNIAPAADAGPDRAVKEGDVVTLNGSFEDANAGDSHSFLWYLENSTNAQTVPDSSTQSLSFTPTDNGVYTFRFTVTDNYGAQGSDTVVVTAWNLPPVTVIDHLTDETGGEIGVYAPDALFGPDVILKASFRDAGTADIHAAQVDWGDGSVDTMFATFTDSTGGAAGSLGAAHDYAAPGIYTITLDVSDDDSGTGRATRQVGVARCRRSCRRP
jgi:hypothetical protein